MKRPVVRLVLLALIGSTTQSGWGQVPPPEAPAPSAPPVPTDPLVRPLDQDRIAIEPGAALVKSFFEPHPLPLDQTWMAGLAAGSKPEMLNWPRVYRLALIHAQVKPPPRFATLDPVSLDEQARALGLEDFAKFRASYVSSRTFRDPAADLLDLQARLLQIEIARRSLAHSEHWVQLLKELINGEASGLGQIDLDHAQTSINVVRGGLNRLIADYRDGLDRFKVALGLAPGATVTLDLAPVASFRQVFDALDLWSLTSNRELSDLDPLVRQLPPIAEFTIGGRSMIDEVLGDPGRLEEVLALATRFALGNRRERDEPADVVELRVRHRLRHLVEIRTAYLLESRLLVLAVRMVDMNFEKIIAPPAGVVPRPPGLANASLIESARQIADHQSRLVALWTTFQAERLAFERDLGLVLVADWPAFFDRFTAPAPQIEAAAPAEPLRAVPIPLGSPPPPPAAP